MMLCGLTGAFWESTDYIGILLEKHRALNSGPFLEHQFSEETASWHPLQNPFLLGL